MTNAHIGNNKTDDGEMSLNQQVQTIFTNEIRFNVLKMKQRCIYYMRKVYYIYEINFLTQMKPVTPKEKPQPMTQLTQSPPLLLQSYSDLNKQSQEDLNRSDKFLQLGNDKNSLQNSLQNSMLMGTPIVPIKPPKPP